MAVKYTNSELKAKLHRSTFQVVKSSGIEGLTVRKVVQGCGLSDPYIYRCYSDLADLLKNAFMEIDEKVSQLIAQVIQANIKDGLDWQNLDGICWGIWSAYWNFLMDDPEQTVFYWRFYQSGHYNEELLQRRRENFNIFIGFMNEAGRVVRLQDKVNLDVLISNIIDNTVSVAVKIHLGYMSEDDITSRTVYQSVFALLFHLLGQDVWKETA